MIVCRRFGSVPIHTIFDTHSSESNESNESNESDEKSSKECGDFDEIDRVKRRNKGECTYDFDRKRGDDKNDGFLGDDYDLCRQEKNAGYEGNEGDEDFFGADVGSTPYHARN